MFYGTGRVPHVEVTHHTHLSSSKVRAAEAYTRDAKMHLQLYHCCSAVLDLRLTRLKEMHWQLLLNPAFSFMSTYTRHVYSSSSPSLSAMLKYLSSYTLHTQENIYEDNNNKLCMSFINPCLMARYIV